MTGYVGTCLHCDESIEIGEDPEIGSSVTCPSCKTDLEIVDLEPVVFDYVLGGKV